CVAGRDGFQQGSLFGLRLHGITAARETLDAALGQKVQTAGGMSRNHARSAAKRTGKDHPASRG
ncbi:MAG TPA: hypothetical protein VGA46_06660, partial [Methyloceanibacter sp.]